MIRSSGPPSRRARAGARLAAFALCGLALAAGTAGHAGGPERPMRYAVSLRAGGFDEQGTGGMLRKDGAPGNPLVGWKASEQVAAAVSFEARPGVTLDLSLVRLDFDFGSDLLPAVPGDGFVTTRIATGDIDEYRFAVWLEPAVFDDDASFFVSNERTSKGRIALAFVASRAETRDLLVAAESRERLGIERVNTGGQTSLGLGARVDYRLGRSRVTIGADLRWMWAVGGDLFTVVTSADSPYAGTTLEHEGFDVLLDLSFHF